MSKQSPAESIFFAALERVTFAERVAFLDQSCGSDEALRYQIERLLTAHEQAGEFLQVPVLEAADLAAYAPPDPTPISAETGGGNTPGGRPLQDDPLAFLTPSEKPGPWAGQWEVHSAACSRPWATTMGRSGPWPLAPTADCSPPATNAPSR